MERGDLMSEREEISKELEGSLLNLAMGMSYLTIGLGRKMPSINTANMARVVKAEPREKGIQELSQATRLSGEMTEACLHEIQALAKAFAEAVGLKHL